MEQFRLEPIEDKLIIKPTDPETTTGGGVYLPEGTQPDATSGVVVSAGPGIKKLGAKDNNERYPMRCKVGDLVFYPKFGAHKIEYDGEGYVIISEGELFCRELPPIFDEKKIDKEEIKKVIKDTEPFKETDDRKLLLDNKDE